MAIEQTQEKLTNVLAEALLWLKDEGYLGII